MVNISVLTKQVEVLDFLDDELIISKLISNSSIRSANQTNY